MNVYPIETATESPMLTEYYNPLTDQCSLHPCGRQASSSLEPAGPEQSFQHKKRIKVPFNGTRTHNSQIRKENQSKLSNTPKYQIELR